MRVNFLSAESTVGRMMTSFCKRTHVGRTSLLLLTDTGDTGAVPTVVLCACIFLFGYQAYGRVNLYFYSHCLRKTDTYVNLKCEIF